MRLSSVSKSSFVIKLLTMRKAMLGRKQAARELGVSEGTIYQWMKRGIIQYVQPVKGGRVFIPESEIDRLLTPKRSTSDQHTHVP